MKPKLTRCARCGRDLTEREANALRQECASCYYLRVPGIAKIDWEGWKL
jgi:ribosomal protein L37E